MGTTEKGRTIGWIVGWIEENKHVFPFVLQVETADKNMDLSKVRIDLLK